MRAMIVILAVLVTAQQIDAGPRNPGVGTGDVVQIWHDIFVDTGGVTPTDDDQCYPIGRDTKGLLDLNIEGLGASESVTLTFVFEMPGGNIGGLPKQAAGTSTIVITDPDPDLQPIEFPRAGRLFMSGETSDSDGVTVTAKIVGW